MDSRVGLAWMAIREDEDVAAVMGIHLVNYKTLAFGFSAALGALAGSFFAVFQSFVSPNSFTLLESVIIIAIPILGGLGSIPSTIIGEIVMIGEPEIFKGAGEYRTVIMGVFILRGNQDFDFAAEMEKTNSMKMATWFGICSRTSIKKAWP